MKFTLTYTGKLKSNGNLKHKHAIRQDIHKQLKVLWSQPPLTEAQRYFDGRDKNINLIHKVGSFRFVPLVSLSLSLIARLDILLLRPGAPGDIVKQGGDIDNRLKTLLDALRTPDDINELPKNAPPAADEDPFFCLLKDDNLVTGLNVEMDRYLKKGAHPSDVHAVIEVHTAGTSLTWGNIALL